MTKQDGSLLEDINDFIHPKDLVTEKQQNKQKSVAKICLIVLLLFDVWQFVLIYKTNSRLTSPIIPRETIWIISKDFVFIAFVFTVASLIGLLLYFFNKYLWVIIFVVLVLVASRFIYLPAT